MEFNDIKAELEAWQHRPDLRQTHCLWARAEALDFLHFAATILPELAAPQDAAAALTREVTHLTEELTACNDALFQWVRTAIAGGALRGNSLRAYFDQFVTPPEEDSDLSSQPVVNDGVHTSYGALDVLVDGIFGLQDAPAPTVTRTAEMVHCEETPALAILDLVDQVDFGPQDRFYDLGCGLGQVVMLIHLLTGVSACGVEIEPQFVDFAQQQAAALGIDDVHFFHADAQTAAYSDGTIFFLFTPFRGAMLQRVLARLHAIAQKQPLRICTFGPCTPTVAAQPWLRPHSVGIPHEYKLTVFDSQSLID
ncbi:MAG: class I SAM-dependent methyltransferase [Caldilineaceae bacterium]|nr:class I SAM-dependent methyltransferase [Caldilineaceae bacterium]